VQAEAQVSSAAASAAQSTQNMADNYERVASAAERTA